MVQYKYGEEKAGRPENGKAREPEGRRVEVTAVPYYAWANRKAGPMRVWLRSNR